MMGVWIVFKEKQLRFVLGFSLSIVLEKKCDFHLMLELKNSFFLNANSFWCLFGNGMFYNQ